MESLLIIDTQNDYINPLGVYAKNSTPLDHTRTIENIKTLITNFDNKNLPVIWLMMEWPIDIKDQSPVWIAQYKKELGSDVRFPVTVGTWGWQIDDRLSEAKKKFHHVVRKTRSSGFFKTDLAIILKNLQVTKTYLCGFFSHGCVEATARDSLMNDFYTSVVVDACGYRDKGLHNNAIAVMSSRHQVTNTGDLNV